MFGDDERVARPARVGAHLAPTGSVEQIAPDLRDARQCDVEFDVQLVGGDRSALVLARGACACERCLDLRAREPDRLHHSAGRHLGQTHRRMALDQVLARTVRPGAAVAVSLHLGIGHGDRRFDDASIHRARRNRAGGHAMQPRRGLVATGARVVAVDLDVVVDRQAFVLRGEGGEDFRAALAAKDRLDVLDQLDRQEPALRIDRDEMVDRLARVTGRRLEIDRLERVALQVEFALGAGEDRPHRHRRILLAHDQRRRKARFDVGLAEGAGVTRHCGDRAAERADARADRRCDPAHAAIPRPRSCR